ncbi:MAG: hypothetical protein QQN63_02590 [Nitrosopumilus sp.]
MNFITKYLTWELFKKLGWILFRWGVKKSPNKADDALLAIGDKIVSGDLTGIEKDVEILSTEVARLVKEYKEKK